MTRSTDRTCPHLKDKCRWGCTGDPRCDSMGNWKHRTGLVSKAARSKVRRADADRGQWNKRALISKARQLGRNANVDDYWQMQLREWDRVWIYGRRPESMCWGLA